MSGRDISGVQIGLGIVHGIREYRLPGGVAKVVGVGIILVDDGENRILALRAPGCGVIEVTKEVRLVAAVRSKFP